MKKIKQTILFIGLFVTSCVWWDEKTSESDYQLVFQILPILEMPSVVLMLVFSLHSSSRHVALYNTASLLQMTYFSTQPTIHMPLFEPFLILQFAFLSHFKPLLALICG